MKNANPLSLSLSILLLGILVYFTFSPALQNDFVNYDDAKYIANNPVIKTLSWSNIRAMFSQVIFRVHHYHPLTILTWAIEYHFVKLTPRTYILDNIILHMANTLLVFWLACQLTKKTGAAFLSALLFSLHPLRVESVVWITERKDVLYSFFYLWGLNVYTHWILNQRQSRKLFFLTHVFFILSCFSKPTAVSFPLALLSVNFFINGNIKLKDFGEKIILFFLSVVIGIISILQKPSAAEEVYQVYSLLDRLILSINAFWFYISKIFFPINLSCYYPLPEKINNHLPFGFYLIAFISIFILVVLFRKIKQAPRIFAWGILFFSVTIFFMVGLISFGSYFIAERYTYIASIGLAIPLAWGICHLTERASMRVKIPLVFLIVLIILTLHVLSVKQTKIWHDGVRLWSNVIQQFPNTEMAYSNRGNAYWKQENYPAALNDYNQAIALNPRGYATLSNRGAVYLRLGQRNLALADFNQAIKLNPMNSQAFNNRGSLLLESGQIELAVQDFTRSLKLQPYQIPALVNRANCYKQLGEEKKAQEDLNRALQINPDFQQYKPQF